MYMARKFKGFKSNQNLDIQKGMLAIYVYCMTNMSEKREWEK